MKIFVAHMARKEEQLQMDILHKMVYADKKITKSQIKEINISMIIDKNRTEHLSLKQASILIVALAKVVVRRFKFLMEDCGLAVQQISRSVSSMCRSARIPSSKAITLSIENNLVLTDDGADIDDSAYEEDPALNEGSMLEIDFGDLPSVEQVRNSAVQSSGIFGSDSMILKKRKITEDRITEIDESVFKGNLRRAADILKKQESIVGEQIKQRLRIDPRIAAIFCKTDKDKAAVELQRGISLAMEELDQSGFTISPDDNAIASGFGDPDSCDFLAAGLDLFALPETFKFSCAVQHLSVSNKASCFFSLLALATEGRIAAQQIEPFSEIECVQIKN